MVKIVGAMARTTRTTTFTGVDEQDEDETASLVEGDGVDAASAMMGGTGVTSAGEGGVGCRGRSGTTEVRIYVDVGTNAEHE